MKCNFCGGQVLESKDSFLHQWDSNFIFIKNVPTEICESCGEKFYSPEVTDEILRISQTDNSQAKKMQIPVLNYAESN